MTTIAGGRIRITDLRNPVLTDSQRETWAYAEANPVELSVDAVLASAAEQAGLDDFGPDDFHERLALQLDEIDTDPNRSPVSRMVTFAGSVRYAANRLRVIDLLKRHPEIHDIEIEAPIVVVGLPRSGTTHLVNLLAADSRFRSLPLWESQEPVPFEGDAVGPDGIDPRIVRSQRRWEQMQAKSPLVAAMHPMNPEHIHEELELECLDFSSYNFEWGSSMAPRWREYYLSHDQRPHYAFMATMLKVLQWQRGPSRWILKCPQHLEQLGPLMDTFPDATVVMTHRDPVSVVQSAATMVGYGARSNFLVPDIDAVCDYWTDRVGRLLDAGTRDLALIPAERRIDVYFDKFMADDVGTVERIYTHTGIEFTDEARAAVDDHIAHHPRGANGQVVYDLRADFGREPAELRTRFADYFEKFPVKVEVQ
ncbi:sulfotransferase family protein [Prescottella equi]|uniref:sulfotransferase family protein n=1 Tax=Rhodococcus hoagii TaxID=43767 RepID=UPI001C768A85|nr:sulfotransferase [Prescottella equi]BCN76654.1 putative sulfotransferase [Prescottella equi]